MAELKLNLGAGWGWLFKTSPLSIYIPGKRTATHLTGQWGSPETGLDGCVDYRTQRGFEPRTFQPVWSRDNNYVIPAP